MMRAPQVRNARISHCTFYNVFNREQGSVIDLTGVQKASVTDCTFDRSGQGGASIRFNEMRWDEIEVSHCNLYEAGRIASFWDTCVKGGHAPGETCLCGPCKQRLPPIERFASCEQGDGRKKYRNKLT